MRMRENLEAYLDDYNTINVYFSKSFFQGQSSRFYLRSLGDSLVELPVSSKETINNYVHYVLSLDHPIEFGKPYFILEEHAQSIPLQTGHIVKTQQFSDEFAPEGSPYGIEYSKKKTRFFIWAPTATEACVILEGDKKQTIAMERKKKGMWEVEVYGDLLHTPYTYMVHQDDQYLISNDPGSMFLTANGLASVVEDESVYKEAKKVPTEPMKHFQDAIIYECSLRDLTSQKGLGYDHPSTYEAFTEEKKTKDDLPIGFDYLKDLGITHLQLMPVLDFGSVDEKHPDLFYNWGYDPMHYQAPEGSFALDPDDAASRVKELQKLVADAHAAGIKVNLDIVYNHVWNKSRFNLEKMVPNYFFLMDRQGNFSNGSFCGNDIDSRPAASKKYMLESLEKIIEVFDIDGFRFDLMGILDYNFMNAAAAMGRRHKPDFMVYGEGWNMPSYVPEDIRASINNQSQMPLIAHFSDRFREAIRGNNYDVAKPGYTGGDVSLLNNAATAMKASMNESTFDTPFKAINYVECHDNHTIWDKNLQVAPNEDPSTRKYRIILENAMVLLAQGTPFLHCGQEFGRTKEGKGNTYNAPDAVNQVDWDLKNKNNDIVQAVKKLIAIRKNHPSLRMNTKEEVLNNVRTFDLAGQVLGMETTLGDDHLFCFFNPTAGFFEYVFDDEKEILFDSRGVNPQKTKKAVIAPVSCVVVQV